MLEQQSHDSSGHQREKTFDDELVLPERGSESLVLPTPQNLLEPAPNQ